MRYSVLSIFAAVILSSAVFAGYKLVEVPISSPTTVSDLQSCGMDIVYIDYARNSVQIVVLPSEEAVLITAGFSYVVKIEDMEAYFASRLGYSDDMGGYHTYEETIEELELLHSLFPDIISAPFSIGQSIEGNELWAIKISDNPDIDEDEPEIFYNGMIHAREPITIELLLYFISHLAEYYTVDPDVQYLIDNREMFILPIINPDGYLRNEATHPSGGGMWRKNMRDNNNSGYFEENEDGVDLNRNWSYMWGYDDIGSSPHPWHWSYRGTEAFSEPETAVLSEFINSREFSIVLNYHSYGNLYLHPWDYDTLYCEDYPVFTELGGMLSAFNEYTVQSGVYLYPVNGGANDWDYGDSTHNKIISYIVEVGSNEDFFWPDEDRIVPLCEENLGPNLTAADYADNPWRVLCPAVPSIQPADTVEGAFTLSWDANTDPDNPAAGFDVRESEGFGFVTDDFESDPEGSWDTDGFEWSFTQFHSIYHSMFSGNSSYSNSLMQTMDFYHVNPGDTLKFWTWYEIEANFDYGYVAVSYDGYTYIPIEGNITSSYNPHGLNLGNGITGNSSGWIEAFFPLADYEGEEILFGFMYKTGGNVNFDGWYIDDVYPHADFENAVMLAEAQPDTFITVEPGIAGGTAYYQVRAIDPEGDISRWSQAEEVVVIPAGISGREQLPLKFEVTSVYPNPFNSSVLVNFTIENRAETVIELFNVLGQKVFAKDLGNLTPGEHSVQIDGEGFSGGIYLMRLSSGNNRAVMKLGLLK